MATQHDILTPSGFKAENDLSAKQFYFVELGTNAGEVDVCDGATDRVVGVLQNKPEAGEAAAVMMYGIAKVVASAAITKGATVGTTNAGKAVAKTADADLVAGIALTTVTTDGELVQVLLTPGCQRAS